jgi:mono/diheme cytochrome c family protein
VPPVLVAEITTLGKTVLLIVAGTFIVWSLYTAMVIPKKHPGFPRRLDAFVVISALLFVAQMGAVFWVTGTQEVEEEEVVEQPETLPAETAPAETGGDAAAGKAVFASSGCGSCHALADANASGAVGPSLDETMPSAELVVDRVTNGQGAMPAFADQLSEEQIADVAAYVSSVAGS